MNKQLIKAAILAAAALAVFSHQALAQAAGAGKSPKQAGNGAVKVFILAGQSNMEGHGGIRTIDALGNDPIHGQLLKKLRNADGSWAVRDDVFVYYKRSDDVVKAPLTVGQGCSSNEIGPELMFGVIMGEYYKEPVLLIKTAWGGKDLYCDFRPPSAGQPAYKIHPAGDKPREMGVSYRQMVAEVKECLANMDNNFPQFKGMKPAIVGFVWFQGFNEMFSGDDTQKQVYAEYASNYAHMIADLEKELKLAMLPSVVGEMGVDGDRPNPLRAAQAAVMNQKSLNGKVAFVKTAQFWDPALDQMEGKLGDEERRVRQQVTAQVMAQLKGKPEAADKKAVDQIVSNKMGEALSKDAGYQKTRVEHDKIVSHWECHYWGSARIYCLVGNGLAEAMKPLVKVK
jgi:alpha-galactosidase